MVEPEPAEIRIGISGWDYDRWRGDFYPAGLPRSAQLAYTAQRMRTVELNGSFYALQSPASYQRWHDVTPEDFVFAVKGGRFITHLKRLRDVETPLANFFASGVTRLGAKLGPFLWQLPEREGFDPGTIDSFLSLLPRSAAELETLARRHDEKVREPAYDVPAAPGTIRHALEVRNPAFRNDTFFDLLGEHDVACVLADSAGRWPELDEATASFDYVRLHGHSTLYTSRYSDRTLARWAERCRAQVGAGRDVYVYFDNDAHGHAPHDALRLAGMLGMARSATGKG